MFSHHCPFCFTVFSFLDLKTLYDKQVSYSCKSCLFKIFYINNNFWFMLISDKEYEIEIDDNLMMKICINYRVVYREHISLITLNFSSKEELIQQFKILATFQ